MAYTMWDGNPEPGTRLPRPLVALVLLVGIALLSACGGGSGSGSGGQVADPTIQVDKSANPASGTEVSLGDTLTYTLNVAVANAVTVEDVVLTDTLGEGLTLDPGSLPAGCSAQGQVITCTLAAGAAIGSHTFEYTATVNEDAITQVGNSVETSIGSCGTCTTSHPVVPREAPQDVTLSFESVKTFRFEWTDVAGATHYKLLENPDGISGYSQVGEDIPRGTGTVALEVPLYARVNARYMVEACSASGCMKSDELLVSDSLVDAIGYFKASNTGVGDWFGTSVALSADGDTLAVGARSENSAATGIDGDQGDSEAGEDSGAVYVFARADGVWQQQAFIKASNTGVGDVFGISVALSADGDTLAVGAYGEDSADTGINEQADNSATNAGAVYVFTRESGVWQQQAFIKASNTGAGDLFGRVVALSADGDTLAVGAYGEDSAAIGIDGDQGDSEAGEDSGAVYVFARADGVWQQQAFIKASNTGAGDAFGRAVALSADGDTLAVGAHFEDGAATGINVEQTNNSATNAGAVYVFTRESGVWQQQAYIKASNTGAEDFFGISVALSADGDTLAVGATGEDSAAIGINGDQADNSAAHAGAVYVFARESGVWQQQAFIKASNTGVGDVFGISVALSADGDTLAVGAYYEDSADTGINGEQTNNSATNAGAVYVFTRESGVWQQQAFIKASNAGAGDQFGGAVALSADGDTLAVGAYFEDSAATGINGNQADNSAALAGAVYVY